MDREVGRARREQGGGAAADRLAVQADAADIEIAVGRRRSGVQIVHERERDGLRARETAQVDSLRGALVVQGGRGVGSADLLAVDLNGELGIALIRVLRDVEDQVITVGAGGCRRRRDGAQRDGVQRGGGVAVDLVVI